MSKRICIAVAAIIVAVLGENLCAVKVRGGDTVVTDGRQSEGVRLAAANFWADSVIATLSLREQVGQLMFPRLDIKNDAAGRKAIAGLVKNGGIGGFLLGKGTLADYKGIIDYAQSIAALPLMVTLDGEWGLAMRVTDAPRFPHNMALGASDDEELMEIYGAEVARECRAVGIHVNFAPVLDVNSNPDNPVIGYRSFGEDPRKVARLGVAYARGLENGGVMPVGKHFPGHGDTSTDSHKTLPVIKRSAKDIEKLELVPFTTYIDAGMSGIMVGHLDIPALDSSGTPASLSAPIVTGLLKGKLGFKGLVWSDALAMKGASAKRGENNCVSALRAGIDVLLQPENPMADIDAVVKAVETGKLSSEVVRERCHKLLTYKYLYVVAPQADTSESVKTPATETIQRRLAASAVTVLTNDDAILPLKDLHKRSIAVVSLGAPASNPFSKLCGRYSEVTAVGAPDGVLSSADITKVRMCNTVIIGIFKQSDAVAASLAKLDRNDADVIAACFINPYRMAKMKEALVRADALLTTHDDTPYLEEAAAQVIYGGLGATGKLPVNLKGWLKAGAGIPTGKTRLGFTTPQAEGLNPNLEARYDSIVREAITAGAIPGCQVLVAKNGNIVIDKPYGALAMHGTTPVTESTLYDVASMSKAIGVVSGLMKEYDRGHFTLTDKISRFVPELRGTDKENITMKQLLLHESGMPAVLSMMNVMLDTATYTPPAYKSKPGGDYTVKLDKNVYANANARLRPDITSATATADFPTPIGKGLYVGQSTFDTIIERVFATELKAPEYRYSDLNFVLLMLSLEAMTGRRLDEFVETEVFEPLGADATMYIPLLKGVAEERIAPTEKDEFLRRQLIRGYVHDELAAFSGGIQGNAGLFSTADDIAKVCQTWLNGGMYGGERIFKESTVNLFTDTRNASGNRALGFDASTNCGSPRVYGHTGFTGTQFKVDPESGLIFVFLSNRVNPTRDNPAFNRSNIRSRLWAELFR